MQDIPKVPSNDNDSEYVSLFGLIIRAAANGQVPSCHLVFPSPLYDFLNGTNFASGQGE